MNWFCYAQNTLRSPLRLTGVGTTPPQLIGVGGNIIPENEARRRMNQDSSHLVQTGWIQVCFDNGKTIIELQKPASTPQVETIKRMFAGQKLDLLLKRRQIQVYFQSKRMTPLIMSDFNKALSGKIIKNVQ